MREIYAPAGTISLISMNSLIRDSNGFLLCDIGSMQPFLLADLLGRKGLRV